MRKVAGHTPYGQSARDLKKKKKKKTGARHRASVNERKNRTRRVRVPAILP